jgi:hypothetical protein
MSRDTHTRNDIVLIRRDNLSDDTTGTQQSSLSNPHVFAIQSSSDLSARALVVGLGRRFIIPLPSVQARFTTLPLHAAKFSVITVVFVHLRCADVLQRACLATKTCPHAVGP